MNDIQRKLDYACAIADWFLEIAEGQNRAGCFEDGLKYTRIAALILARQNRVLSYESVEANLQFIAERLVEHSESNAVRRSGISKPQVHLHVLSEVLPAGGLTTMATRWIKNDSNGRIHSLVLLAQEVPVPNALSQAVLETGGRIYIADPRQSLLQRARWLRGLANELATHVILYIDVADVICGAAFGAKGGPPILLVNQNAHTYWTGASFVDLVVNCRGSDLERTWTELHRGIPRGITVPIPLPEPVEAELSTESFLEISRQAKKAIGIPDGATVVLTVGPSCKYLAIEGLDFVAVFESILRALPNTYLIGVGMVEDQRWSSASERVGRRIRVLGTLTQAQLATVHNATDLYVEGFPFGTTTALLEAGLKGIPVVLAPTECPPPFGSDGVALDGVVERPRTMEQYKSTIARLCGNPEERYLQGRKLREAIAKHHTGHGWSKYLDAALKEVPSNHLTYPFHRGERTPTAIHEYWAMIASRWGVPYEETLESAVLYAMSVGLQPQLTATFLKACREYNDVRRHRTIPLTLLKFLLNVLLARLPKTWAPEIFRFFSFVYREAFLRRLMRRLCRKFGKLEDRPAPYQEYRQMKAE